jgi:hypothetical protein
VSELPDLPDFMPPFLTGAAVKYVSCAPGSNAAAKIAPEAQDFDGPRFA